MQLSPNQIITSSHTVIHDPHVLKIYFHVYQKAGDILPPAPVMHRDLMMEGFDEELKEKFREFIKNNPQAEYILLDGSHKTTAADLAGYDCNVMLFESGDDIRKAKEMEKQGEILQYLLGDTIQEIIEDIAGHFMEKRFFWTVEEKTKYLVENKKIPRYMIEKF